MSGRSQGERVLQFYRQGENGIPIAECNLTCVSVRCNEAARPALSELDRYRLRSNVDSNWKTWLREKTVRVFFFRLLPLSPPLLLPVLPFKELLLGLFPPPVGDDFPSPRWRWMWWDLLSRGKLPMFGGEDEIRPPDLSCPSFDVSGSDSKSSFPSSLSRSCPDLLLLSTWMSMELSREVGRPSDE